MLEYVQQYFGVDSAGRAVPVPAIGRRAALPVASFAFLAGAFIWVASRSGEEMSAATQEDGVVQVVGAVALAAAAIAFAAAFWWSDGRGWRLGRLRTRRNVTHLALAGTMFMACGEEVSWGQHTFGFATPPAIAEQNEQEEFNVHNLWLFDARVDGELKTGLARQLTLTKAFSALTLGLGVALPLLHAGVPAVRRITEDLGIPIPPLWLAAFLLLALAWARLGPPLPVDARPGAMSEVRESLYSYGLLVIALYAAWSARIGRRTPPGP
ncbi:MAG: hypothetical protein WD734_01230 [Dehalococcoidia bacterium]